MKTILDQTLDELEGTESTLESEWKTYVVMNCQRLQRVPLKDFTVEDLRLMIGQGFSLEYLVPLGLRELECDPLAEGIYYEGDLLESMSRIPMEFWEQHQELDERWQSILIVVANLPPDILEDLPSYLLSKLKLS